MKKPKKPTAKTSAVTTERVRHYQGAIGLMYSLSAMLDKHNYEKSHQDVKNLEDLSEGKYAPPLGIMHKLVTRIPGKGFALLVGTPAGNIVLHMKYGISNIIDIVMPDTIEEYMNFDKDMLFTHASLVSLVGDKDNTPKWMSQV